jgi:hypothetical protein
MPLPYSPADDAALPAHAVHLSLADGIVQPPLTDQTVRELPVRISAKPQLESLQSPS